ncbi:MAG: thymidylate synthase [Planctomycetes bacterium]|nr:thymidylate synthase [Planctomycetota bacterium]
MSHDAIVVPAGNLSVAWALAFVRVFDAPRGELPHPLVLSITEFNGLREPVENAEIRAALDRTIIAINRVAGKRKVQNVSATASTIFPHMCWSPRAPRPATELFEHYTTRVFPRLKRICGLNRRGTYFLRMIDATGVHGVALEPKRVNQLGEILRWWERDEGTTRRSALQVSLYDPAKDHTGAALAGFPCLQQISFSHTDQGLALSAYYPTEYIFDRGYGNYLGLCQLATFMAHEMDLPLARVNIFVALPERGGVSKSATRALATCLRGIVSEAPVAEEATA